MDEEQKAFLVMMIQSLEVFASLSLEQIDKMLPSMSLLKTAQYESGQYYNILNGRAFEKAWREKRKQKPSDDSRYHLDEKGYYRSANECWWDTLEEYQDKLFGKHKDWLAKHAGDDVHRVVVAKPKKDKKEEEEASGTMSPGTTMSGPMTDEAKKRRDGKGVQEWLEEGGMPLPAYRKAAGEMFMAKVSERIEAGSSAGVAFYEAMDYMMSAEMPKDLVKKANDLVAKVEAHAKAVGDKELEKAAQHWMGKGLNLLRDVGKGVGKAWEGVKDWGKQKMTEADYAKQMEAGKAAIEQTLHMMYKNPIGAPKMMGQLQKQVSDFASVVQSLGGAQAAPAAEGTAPAAGQQDDTAEMGEAWDAYDREQARPQQQTLQTDWVPPSAAMPVQQTYPQPAATPAGRPGLKGKNPFPAPGAKK